MKDERNRWTNPLSRIKRNEKGNIRGSEERSLMWRKNPVLDSNSQKKVYTTRKMRNFRLFIEVIDHLSWWTGGTSWIQWYLSEATFSNSTVAEKYLDRKLHEAGFQRINHVAAKYIKSKTDSVF